MPFGTTLAAGTSLGQFAWASRPSASTSGVGATFTATDVGLSYSRWVSDGTTWRPQNGVLLLYRQAADIATTANSSEQFHAQVTLPAGLMSSAEASIWVTFGTNGKSNTAETFTWRLRVGTAGTSSDAIWLASVGMATTVLSASTQQACRRVSSTTLRKIGIGTTSIANNTLVNTSGGDTAAAFTVGNLDSVANILSVSSQASVGAETAVLHGFTVELKA